jgi:hypothetical protein
MAFAVSLVSLPPFGMVSRASTARPSLELRRRRPIVAAHQSGAFGTEQKLGAAADDFPDPLFAIQIFSPSPEALQRLAPRKVARRTPCGREKTGRTFARPSSE